MAYLDSVLADNEFLAGENFSVADITAFAGLGFADFAKVEIPESLTNLHAWRKKVAARPSIAG
ncbi:glutathione binding-like protein [Marinobacter alkaliphilus]|jgi:glutathione S-transferase